MARKKESTQPRLVAYYRYSGGSRQTEQSIEGQRRDCEAYARAHGMTILREYVDRHISGKTDDRAQFRQMIDDSAKRTFDLVICWKTDRFARNRYDSAVYKKQLRDNGVSVIYAAESNIEGAEGIIIEGLMWRLWPSITPPSWPRRPAGGCGSQPSKARLWAGLLLWV